MHENVNHFSFIVIANKDRTMASASLSTKDLLKFLVTNYQSNMQVFNKAENKIDNYMHQNLVCCYKDDNLIEVLHQMKQKRISCIPIEDRNII